MVILGTIFENGKPKNDFIKKEKETHKTAELLQNI